MSTETLHLPNKWETWNHNSIMNTLKYLFNNLCKTEEQRELWQKLNELRMNKSKVRIKENVLAKKKIDYLIEIKSLLKLELKFNQRIKWKISVLENDWKKCEEFYEIKSSSDWEILSLEKDLESLTKNENDDNLKKVIYLISYSKNIDELLKIYDKEKTFENLIRIGEFDFIIDNIEFLGENGFFEKYKVDWKVDYSKVINNIIDNWWWESVCLRFKDFEKISYEDYKIIVDKLREKKVSVHGINTFINAYWEHKNLYGDWWFNKPYKKKA